MGQASRKKGDPGTFREGQQRSLQVVLQWSQGKQIQWELKYNVKKSPP